MSAHLPGLLHVQSVLSGKTQRFAVEIVQNGAGLCKLCQASTALSGHVHLLSCQAGLVHAFRLIMPETNGTDLQQQPCNCMLVMNPALQAVPHSDPCRHQDPDSELLLSMCAGSHCGGPHHMDIAVAYAQALPQPCTRCLLPGAAVQLD